MPSALVTGGGRGIGANVARVLAGDGWDVVVTARSADEIGAVAGEIGGRAIVMDVTDHASVESGFDAVGPVDLLIANAGGASADWWQTFEVNVLGVHLTCSAALARGVGRIVVVGSGAGYLPGASDTAYTSSKAAANRYAECLNNAVEIPVFLISPGRVKTALTAGSWPDDDPGWVPIERSAELVRKLATGRYDVLAGRYLHATEDLEEQLARAGEIVADDLYAIRLRR